MRVIVMFDLPSVTSAEKKQYSAFRKFLINEGFFMMQESIYTKLVLNSQNAKLLQSKVRRNSPDEGIIQMLVVTEKQFNNIEYISGSSNKLFLQDTNRVVVF